MEQRCIWSSDRCEWVMNCEKLLGFITPEEVANQQSTMNRWDLIFRKYRYYPSVFARA